MPSRLRFVPPPVSGGPHALRRFIEAQQPVYEQVLVELAAAAKTSHWMWFVFPQLRELGRSGMAQRFGIASAAEARAYSEHAVLGPRLLECSTLVLRAGHRSIEDIFGGVDALKLRSSMTLFERTARDGTLFAQVLDQRCTGQRCALTLDLLG